MYKPPGEKETKEDGLLHGLIVGPLVLWLHDLLEDNGDELPCEESLLGAAAPGELPGEFIAPSCVEISSTVQKTNKQKANLISRQTLRCMARAGTRRGLEGAQHPY